VKIISSWLHEFVDFDLHRVADLARKLTNVGLAVEFEIPVRLVSQFQDPRAESDPVAEGMVFEMEIGTNRPDAMNHYGVAREAAAVYDLPLKPLEARLPTSTGNACFPIHVEEPQLCPRFSARVIRGTQIKASPEKIAHRLQLLDQRPISNAVDATNYVLWEMGKPTHVFDMDLLEGGKLIIRKAKNG
jgi:phenylalanyl-tRNA synthetase beta chain